MAQKNLPDNCNIYKKDLEKLSLFQPIYPQFHQAVSILNNLEETLNVSDEMGIVHEPRPSLLMLNDDYTQARSATKRSARKTRQYDGEIEGRPSMIHL